MTFDKFSSATSIVCNETNSLYVTYLPTFEGLSPVPPKNTQNTPEKPLENRGC